MKCLIAKRRVWTGVFLTTLLLGCGSPPETADLILTHPRVIDGTGAVHEDATIAITGDRIQTITDAETPFNATVTIDAGGKTVLPGLIDTHIHFGVGRAVDEESLAEFLNNGLPANLQEYLSHGVTTIKSTGDIAEPVLSENSVEIVPGPTPSWLLGQISSRGVSLSRS